MHLWGKSTKETLMRKHTLTTCQALLALLFFSACAPWVGRFRIAKERFVPISDSGAAFVAALESVVGAGFTVAVADRGSGLIQTEWRATSRESRWYGQPLRQRRIMVVVQVTDKNVVVVPHAQVCWWAACDDDQTMTDAEIAMIRPISEEASRAGGSPPAPKADDAPASVQHPTSFAGYLPGELLFIHRTDGGLDEVTVTSATETSLNVVIIGSKDTHAYGLADVAEIQRH
jgi:hypothetical protein